MPFSALTMADRLARSDPEAKRTELDMQRSVEAPAVEVAATPGEAPRGFRLPELKLPDFKSPFE